MSVLGKVVGVWTSYSESNILVINIADLFCYKFITREELRNNEVEIRPLVKDKNCVFKRGNRNVSHIDNLFILYFIIYKK